MITADQYSAQQQQHQQYYNSAAAAQYYKTAVPHGWPNFADPSNHAAVAATMTAANWCRPRAPSDQHRLIKKKCQPVPAEVKDDVYWLRRHKNNESARRSREARRHKEEAVAMCVARLETENMQLRHEMFNLRREIDNMRSLLASVYSSTSSTVISANSVPCLNSTTDSG